MIDLDINILCIEQFKDDRFKEIRIMKIERFTTHYNNEEDRTFFFVILLFASAVITIRYKMKTKRT